jgi:hypothetical protein
MDYVEYWAKRASKAQSIDPRLSAEVRTAMDWADDRYSPVDGEKVVSALEGFWWGDKELDEWFANPTFRVSPLDCELFATKFMVKNHEWIQLFGWMIPHLAPDTAERSRELARKLLAIFVFEQCYKRGRQSTQRTPSIAGLFALLFPPAFPGESPGKDS